MCGRGVIGDLMSGSHVRHHGTGHVLMATPVGDVLSHVGPSFIGGSGVIAVPI